MRAISVLCVSVASLWAFSAVADIYGHDYFKPSGAYVGMQQRPSQSGYSAPSRGYYDPAPYSAPNALSADDLAAIAAAQEWARATARLAAEREKLQRLESQARRAVDAKIVADAQARRAPWLANEMSIQAAEREHLDAMLAERQAEWEAKEALAKQAVLADYQRELREYSHRWDMAAIVQESQERSEAMEAQHRVAEAHAIVVARYAGDGQQVIRDRRRARDNAWAAAARDVRTKRSAELQTAARNTGEAHYEAAAFARLQTKERSRLADWDRQQSEFRLAAETRTAYRAEARRLAFEREESVLLAKARAEAEQKLLQLEQAWARGWTEPGPVETDEPAQSPSLPEKALPGALLVTVLTGAGALLRFRMA
jgi:hypothetical protein